MENSQDRDEGCLSDEDIFDDELSSQKSLKSGETNSQTPSVSAGRRNDDNLKLRCRLTGVPPPPYMTDARCFDVELLLQLWNRNREALSMNENSVEDSSMVQFHELGYSINEDSSCEEYELLLLKFSEWYNSNPTASTCTIHPVESVNEEPNLAPAQPTNYLKFRKDSVKSIPGPWRLPNRTIAIRKIPSSRKPALLVPPLPERPARVEPLDALKKRKLLWAVSTALKQRGVRLNHPEFKVKFNRLYSRTVEAWQSGGYSIKSSTSDAMLSLASHLM